MEKGAWPLVGRREEIAAIDAALSITEGPVGWLSPGRPGSGKHGWPARGWPRPENRGADPLGCRHESARAVPLGAFSGLLGTVALISSSLVARAATELLDGLGSVGAVVGVDDAHLFDRRVGPGGAAPRRSHQSARRGHRPQGHADAGCRIPAVEGRACSTRIELQCLSETETADLLARVLHGQVGRTTTGRLWAMTRGSPLYLKLLG